MKNLDSFRVISQVFQSFYRDRIEAEYLLGQTRRESLDISMTLFWFSVLDFYSGLYFIGEKGKVEYHNPGKANSTIKLASREAWKLFMKEFFHGT